jgi:hypothetical protein
VTTTNRQFKNEQEVLHHLQDDMVKWAEQLVIDLNLPKGDGLSKGRTQASKALEVAQTAGSLKVFVNWLRYQAGRERPAEFWSRQTSKESSLARALTLALGTLQRRIDKEWSTADDQQRRAVMMQAATRFMGYFRRALIGADYLGQVMLADKEGT